MKIDYDAIIIGAGPAGASCAKHLVENEVKTLVVEKKKLPREKTCFGVIFNETIKFINKYFREIPDYIKCSNSYKKFKYSFDGKNFHRFPLKKNLNLIREKLDYFLLNESKADVLEEAIYINHIENNDGTISVKIRQKDRELSIKCNYLIGADGSYSIVRRRLDDNFNKKNFVIGLQKVIVADSNIPDNTFYHVFNKNYSDFFFWFGIKDNYLKFGTSFYYENKRNNYIDKVIEYLKNNFSLRIKNLIHDEYVLINLNNDTNKFFFGKNNILLIGEAASFTGGFGEGIHYALLSGKYAAESIIKMQGKKLDIYKKKTKKIINRIKFSWHFINFNKKIYEITRK